MAKTEEKKIESLTSGERFGRGVLTFLKYFSLALAAFISLLPLVSCLMVAFKTTEE